MSKKSYMFQYATKHKVFADTGLITLEEAVALWKKYEADMADRWGELDSPEMVIWTHCKNNTDYHRTIIDVDYYDCVLEGSTFYRVKKERISIDDLKQKEEQK